MPLKEDDGHFILGIGFVLWMLSSYITYWTQLDQMHLWLADLSFKTGTILIIVGALIAIEAALQNHG